MLPTGPLGGGDRGGRGRRGSGPEGLLGLAPALELPVWWSWARGGRLIPIVWVLTFFPRLLEADQLTGKMEMVTFYEFLSWHTIASCFPAP